jgi:arsenite-transporting ATPase
VTGLDLLLDALPSWMLVGGKGGVGKTTCATALAMRAAERGQRVLLLSTDPAGALGDMVGVRLNASPTPVPGCPGLFAMQLDAAAARETFLAKWRDTLVTILDRGTYLDDDDITGLIDASLPGADEAMALLTIAGLPDEGGWDRITIDTAPTGHTVRLLSLPQTFAALVELLDTMQAKYRFMVSALTHRYRPDAADAFIEEMRGEIARLRAILEDPARCAMALVARPEPVVSAETVRYAAMLRDLGVSAGALVINAVPPVMDDEGAQALAELATLTGIPSFHVRRLDRAPIGIAAVAGWGEAVQPGMPAAAGTASDAARRDREPAAHSDRAGRAEIAIRALTIVGGKGGVGKTSVACALALEAAERSRVLLVSTDPAPSVADALAQRIDDAEVPVTGAEHLVARQMDAAAAFERMRSDYQRRVDALFDGLVGHGIDAAHDRAIIRDLMTLAPPGIDELYALASLGETLAEARFDVIIVDPAPTGHLLRLLEMPSLALDWAHRLLRLMLKYREVVGLGETAEELLAFAKRTRAVRDLLADRQRAGLFVVALDEPIVRNETQRLVSAVLARGVGVIGVLWNRTSAAPLPLSLSDPVPQLVSAEVIPPPVGVDALRRWRASWIPLHPADD